MSDLQTLKKLEASRLQSSNEGTLANTAGALIAIAHTREQAATVTDANATANVAEYPVGVVTLASTANGGGGAKFVSGNVTPPANLVANTTNFVTVNLWKRPIANVAAQTLVAQANIAANVPAWTSTALVVANQANAVVAPGDVLTVTVTKGGSGGFLANGAAALVDFAFEDI